MSVQTLSIGEQAWSTFLQIESAIVKHFDFKIKIVPRIGKVILPVHNELVSAVKRLGLAILMKYNLGDRDFKLNSRHETIVQKECLQNLSLTSINDMFNAKVFEFLPAEEGFGPQMIAHDSWVEGEEDKPAGFYERPSLVETLKKDYPAVRLAVDGLVVEYREPSCQCVLV
jgi:hypothetical protein